MISRKLNIPEKQSFFLFGPRQTGKSTLIRSVLPVESKTINLLHSEVYLAYQKDPAQFRKDLSYAIKTEGVQVVFVDEVQKIPLLLDEVHALMEECPACQFILTGSSARKLKHGASNLLAGRAIQRYLFPFVRSEFGERFQLDEVLRFGSLPALFNASDGLKYDILESYVHTYLKEEIQAEGIVRQLPAFARFLDVAAAGFTEILNYSNVARECGLSVRGVQGHYDILEDTMIGHRLPAWNKSIRQQLVAHPKFYFFDNGVSNALNHLLRDVSSPLTRGRLFEQWAINEIRAEMSYRRSDLKMHYWRTKGGVELDLVLAKMGEIILALEFKATGKIDRSHFKSLKIFREEHPQVPCYLVSEVRDPYEEDGITVCPFDKFFDEILPRYF